MTTPAEDPRGGEVEEAALWQLGYAQIHTTPPAVGRGDTDAIRAGVRALTGFTDYEIDELGGIGRGDTDSGGEGDCFDVCQGHPTGDKRATDGGMRDYFDAQAAELAAELDEPAARPAGDRAQPTQEHSTDLTPGVVWTDAQLAVVRDLTARAVRAEAAADGYRSIAAELARRRALDGT